MIREYGDSDIEDILEVWLRASRVAHPFLPEEFLTAESETIRNVHRLADVASSGSMNRSYGMAYSQASGAVIQNSTRKARYAPPKPTGPMPRRRPMP